MKEGTVSLKINDSTVVWTLKENSYVYTNFKGGTSDGVYNLALNFTKDGQVNFTEKFNNDNFESNGKWEFQGRVGKAKNKEHISIHLESIKGYTGYFDSFNKSQVDFSYKIKELRNEKLVLVSENELLTVSSTRKVYITAEYSFEQ